MICPVCKEAGKKSVVRDRGSSSTYLGYQPYHDEDGASHSHNPNTLKTLYECTRGHSWTVASKRPCKSCNYGAGTEKVTIHDS